MQPSLKKKIRLCLTKIKYDISHTKLTALLKVENVATARASSFSRSMLSFDIMELVGDRLWDIIEPVVDRLWIYNTRYLRLKDVCNLGPVGTCLAHLEGDNCVWRVFSLGCWAIVSV